jgi:hypothetical protein
VREIPEGYRLEWVLAPNWKIGGEGRKCRMLRCPNAAVAAMQRKRQTKFAGLVLNWWHYCEDHLYGRKIEDGVVKEERLVPHQVNKPA